MSRNLFSGLSKNQKLASVFIGTFGALTAVILITTVVSLIPVSERLQLLILYAVGLASLVVAYSTLLSKPAKTKSNKPKPITPKDHSHDSRNMSK